MFIYFCKCLRIQKCAENCFGDTRENPNMSCVVLYVASEFSPNPKPENCLRRKRIYASCIALCTKKLLHLIAFLYFLPTRAHSDSWRSTRSKRSSHVWTCTPACLTSVRAAGRFYAHRLGSKELARNESPVENSRCSFVIIDLKYLCMLAFAVFQFRGVSLMFPNTCFLPCWFWG